MFQERCSKMNRKRAGQRFTLTFFIVIDCIEICRIIFENKRCCSRRGVDVFPLPPPSSPQDDRLRASFSRICIFFSISHLSFLFNAQVVRRFVRYAVFHIPSAAYNKIRHIDYNNNNTLTRTLGPHIFSLFPIHARNI